MYNASGLFYKHLHADRFINALSIDGAQDTILREARKKVRKAIRHAFTNSSKYLLNHISIDDINAINKIRPKFFTQGSYAYKTLNCPCYKTQEIDLDDGVYLPMSFVNGNPLYSKNLFFRIVDGALQELANKEGWKFSNEKDTCSRIILPNQAHIDVPLYAISDERHTQMTEAIFAYRQDKGHFDLSDMMFSADLNLANFFYLNEDEVYLAVRSKEMWQSSDPMAIARWFSMEVATRGERLRRVCRFLKSWRDYVWESGGPSSLVLMVCACLSYPEDDNSRDDYALLKIIEALPGLLRGEIFNQATPHEKIYPRNGIDVNEICEEARLLHQYVASALSGSLDKQGVINSFKHKFGERIPSNKDWVEDLAAPAATVRNTASVKQKPRPIPNTRAG